MNPLLRRGESFMLVVGMAGVKMGDRLAQIGCSHGGRLAAVAARVGLSGRAVAIVPDAASAERARKGAANAGVLIEVEASLPTRLPLEDASIDLAIVDDAGMLVTELSDEARAGSALELLRSLRPGGRVLFVGASPPTGLAAILSRREHERSLDATPVLQSAGFRSVRTLGEREGLFFVEGMKAR